MKEKFEKDLLNFLQEKQFATVDEIAKKLSMFFVLKTMII